MADTYTDDPDRQAAALAAVKAITTTQLRSEADKSHKIEAALATTVDIAAAIRRRNREALERINPAIVEAYLNRLADARVLATVQDRSPETGSFASPPPTDHSRLLSVTPRPRWSRPAVKP